MAKHMRLSKPHALLGAIILVGVILLGLVMSVMNSRQKALPRVADIDKTSSSDHGQNFSGPTPVADKAFPQQKVDTTPISPRWIAIGYADLLDKSALTHTGKTVAEELRNTADKGLVQPFVDRYSELLQAAVEMTLGRDSTPHHNVVDSYPVGSRQPAWVAIFRNGRVFAATDNKAHVRLFLLGDDPQKAYKVNYSKIRHCLRALLPIDGSALHVEVFVYWHDYQSSELHLNLQPWTFQATSFAPPSQTVALDLDGLGDFFNKRGQLEGAKLDKTQGLVLYAKAGDGDTLSGQPISLADLAVAYRAVFHAGDNDAYISLDPHKNPTKVTVNFGGFLEDTKIGAVVLAADERFKTITSGLDPTSFEDLRGYTRKSVPTFLTSAERDLLGERFTDEKADWVGTRFWFYPESVEVESDFDYRYARIANPQFTADAERSKDDFASPEEFEKRKKASLSPSILSNIQHLNQNYPQYAEAYAELRELRSVGRLMGICSWLKKAITISVDLDALLSVELPAFRTERDRTQLIGASLISCTKPDNMNEDMIKEDTKVVFLSPVLEKTVKEYFVSSDNLATFLGRKHASAINTGFLGNAATEANSIMSGSDTKKVRELIETKKDLQALAEYAVSGIELPAPRIAQKYKSAIDEGDRKLEQLKLDLDRLKLNLGDSATQTAYDSYNDLVVQYNSLLEKVNRDIDAYNQLKVHDRSVIEIGGGISLDPKEFKITPMSTNPKFKEFQRLADEARLDGQVVSDTTALIRSRSQPGGDYQCDYPKFNWVRTVTTSADSTFEHLTSGTKHDYWATTVGKGDSWRDLLRADESTYRERMFTKSDGALHIAEYEGGVLKQYIVGKKVDDNTIVFTKPTRRDLMKPQEPPVWWANQ
jgi:hypothetical protein